MKKKYKILLIILLIIIAIGVYFIFNCPRKHSIVIRNDSDYPIILISVKVDSKTLLSEKIELSRASGRYPFVLRFYAHYPKKIKFKFFDPVLKTEFSFIEKLPYGDKPPYEEDIVGYLFWFIIKDGTIFNSYSDVYRLW